MLEICHLLTELDLEPKFANTTGAVEELRLTADAGNGVISVTSWREYRRQPYVRERQILS